MPLRRWVAYAVVCPVWLWTWVGDKVKGVDPAASFREGIEWAKERYP